MNHNTCAVEVCNRQAKGTYCVGHSKRHSEGRDMTTPIRSQSKHGVPARERLYSKLDMSGGPAACWEWQGHTRKRSTNTQPYGRMSYVKDGRLTEYIHVVSFEVHRGRRVPEGLEVRHLCHNPKCGNPMHLAEGTRLQNAQDSVRAGRIRSWFKEQSDQGTPYDRWS
jgi:hypothetical protein